MAITTFYADQRFDEVLDDLRRHYGVASKAEVLRKAVALLRVAQENEHADGSLWIRTARERSLQVIMRQPPVKTR